MPDLLSLQRSYSYRSSYEEELSARDNSTSHKTVRLFLSNLISKQASKAISSTTTTTTTTTKSDTLQLPLLVDDEKEKHGFYYGGGLPFKRTRKSVSSLESTSSGSSLEYEGPQKSKLSVFSAKLKSSKSIKPGKILYVEKF